ncbi:MAG: hypothetical protein LRY76_06715 [Alphaproteobacteria bacterium]|nr:hypothetical protein [Alphaproteobacteria bacterium]
MQALISMAGSAAALVLCAVSAAMNYLFLSSLGKTPLEGQVLGAASASADVLKALLPFFIAWSWQARRLIAAVSGSLAFAFFAGFSLLSAIGFAADNRGALVQERADLSSAYARVQDMRAYADAQRKALPTHRASAIVSEEIARHRQNRRWASTKGCTDATEKLSRDYCAAYFSLRAERATAQEAERLASEIGALDAEASRLRAQGAGNDSDPQVSLLSRILGQEKEPVRLTLIIAVALLVEIGASLGLFLASGHGGAGKKAAEPETERPAGSVEDFALEALVPSNNTGMPISALFNLYQRWCSSRSYTALPEGVFSRDFDDLARAVGLAKRNRQYCGIAAVSAPAVRTPALLSDAMDRATEEFRE